MINRPAQQMPLPTYWKSTYDNRKLVRPHRNAPTAPHGDAAVGRNRCSAFVNASPDAFNTAKVRVFEYAHRGGCVSESALGTGPSWRHTGCAATPVAGPRDA